MLVYVADSDTHEVSRGRGDGSELVGTTEITEILRVSRQRVYQLSRLPDWPEPIARLAMGAIWRKADIETWARSRGRDPL